MNESLSDSVADATIAQKRSSSSPRHASPIARNVGMMLATATLIGFWIWRYTPWHEEVAAILGLGGALAWVAAFLKIIPEEKTKEFQNALFESAFKRKSTFGITVTIFIAAVLVFSNFASVEIEPFNLPAHRSAFIYPIDSANSDRARSAKIADEDFQILSPKESLRILVPLWRRTGTFIVKVSGYPDLMVKLRPWQKLDLTLPASFRRPVALVRPNIPLLDSLTEPWALKIGVNGKLTTNTFDGHPFWIGCDSDVEIPKQVQLGLQSELKDQRGLASLENLWAYPKRDFYLSPDLKAGDHVVVEAQPPVGTPIRVEFDVSPAQATAEFTPQIAELNLPP